MARLVKCRSCHERIANNAMWCPHCGGATDANIFVALFSFIAVVVGGGWIVHIIFN